MFRLPNLWLLAAVGSSLAAQTSLTAAQASLTIGQFEKSIPALHAMHDKQAARELASMQLVERAGLERAAHWQSEMPGKLSSEALTALVDASGFLHPPEDETPATPAPDVATQKQILARAVDTLAKTLHKLPDFYATRTTEHFEAATPAQLLAEQQALSSDGLNPGGILSPAPRRPGLPHHELGPVDPAAAKRTRLYFIEAGQRTVTYREGSEVANASQGADGWPAAFLGLETRGEFGPILHMVLEDALERGVTWSHWETGATGPLAVFRYAVPKEFSHYEIDNRSGKTPDFPAYQGELAIDPGSGAILRIAIQAVLRGEAGVAVDSNVLVEYGPVDIGGRTYTCPVHGVAITKTEDQYASQPDYLNDITFTGYHLFRAEVRILP
jgi:hypothetical protein